MEEQAKDRELLERAAKAAGMQWCWHGKDFCTLRNEKTGLHMPWNPLTDDSDAFRLMVALGVELFIGMRGKCVYARLGDVFEEAFVHHDGDKAAATRRAIVLAAAELGKGA